MALDASRIDTEPLGAHWVLTRGIASAATPAPHPPAGEPGIGPTIEFARSDLAARWRDDYAGLLQLADACDVTTLIAGTVNYNPDAVEPSAGGSGSTSPSGTSTR